jgi:hypothetical protein
MFSAPTEGAIAEPSAPIATMSLLLVTPSLSNLVMSAKIRGSAFIAVQTNSGSLHHGQALANSREY